MKLLFLSDFVPVPNLIYDLSIDEQIHNADYVFFNLEGSPLTGSDIDKPNQIMPFKVEDVIKFVVKYGINKFILALANNHILDNGLDGFDYLIKQLSSFGIKYFGTKEKPYINLEDQVTVLNFVTAETVAKFSSRKRLNYLFHNPENINKQIKEIEAIKSKPIMYPHWGRDMDTTVFSTYKFNFDENKWLVFGHHPHLISGVQENFIYSLGNTFIPHPYYYKAYPWVRYGIALTYDTNTETTIKFLTTVGSNDGFCENFILSTTLFKDLPIELVEHGNKFTGVKRVFLKIFAFSGSKIDYLRLTALQVIRLLYKIKIRKVTNK